MRLTLLVLSLLVFEGAYGPDKYTDFMLDFITRHQDQPFFLYYPMCLTHDPFQPTPDHQDYEIFDPATKLNDPAFFGGYVAYMDKMIGKILTRLEELDLKNNTLILFTGDNGTGRKVVSQWRGRQVKGMKGIVVPGTGTLPHYQFFPRQTDLQVSDYGFHQGYRCSNGWFQGLDQVGLDNDRAVITDKCSYIRLV